MRINYLKAYFPILKYSFLRLAINKMIIFKTDPSLWFFFQTRISKRAIIFVSSHYFFFWAASHSIMVTGRPLSMTGDPSKSVLAVLAWE